LHELDYWDGAVFVTLTYDDDHLPNDEELKKNDLQRYFKRLRKRINGQMKYYACGEYGERMNRPHYHAIIFGLSILDKWIIDDAWRLGFVAVGTVTERSIKYVTNYIQKGLKKEVKGVSAPPFNVMSKGLGERWIKAEEEKVKKNLKITVNGIPVGIPKYYRKKIDVDTDVLYNKAKETLDELEHYYIEKYGNEVPSATFERVLKARVQAEKNIVAKNKLKER
jgi:hypothetical protein